MQPTRCRYVGNRPRDQLVAVCTFEALCVLCPTCLQLMLAPVPVLNSQELNLFRMMQACTYYMQQVLSDTGC
jgi:hypothetical protein